MEISMIDDCWYLLPDNDGRCDKKSKKKKEQNKLILLTWPAVTSYFVPGQKKKNQTRRKTLAKL